jgi:hypothetical protein
MTKPDNEYIYNGDFEIIKGAAFFTDGEIKFPKYTNQKKTDNTKRTRAGPTFATNAQIYENNDDNCRLAMRRLMGKRAPDQLGLHEELFDNQRAFFDKEKPFFDQLRKNYSKYFDDFTNSEEECEEHYSDVHPKKLLRIRAYEELLESGMLFADGDKWVKTVLWKMKKDEWAKHGKKPRMIGDLGVAASLRGFRLTGKLKEAQSNESIDYKGGKIFFCKSPDPFALQYCFEQLVEPDGDFFFVYFSDDSCLSIRRGATIDRYNLDISSCDASHGPAVFETLQRLVPERCEHDMKMLIDQCQLPLRVVSCANRKNVVILKPKRPMLYSGSTITTAINNIANVAIVKSIVDRGYQGPSDIELGAKNAGYIVTGCKPLEFVEDLQFLKNSPVRDMQGNWRPLLNLGVLLRASGTCKGDLPGKGSLYERARCQQRGLLRGSYPRTSFTIFNNMVEAMGEGTAYPCDLDFEYKVVDNPLYPPFVADDTSVYLRYRLTQLEIIDLLANSHSDVFTEFASPGASKILFTDYGLTSVDHLGQSI